MSESTTPSFDIPQFFGQQNFLKSVVDGTLPIDGSSVSYSYGNQLDWGKPELIRGEGKHILACKRYPLAKLYGLIPPKMIEALEQNQQLALCCRHHDNMDVEAWYSCEEEYKKGVPDIYIFKCNEVHPDLVVQDKDENGNLLWDDDGEPQMVTIPNPRPNKECWHVRFMVGGNHPVTGEKDIRPFWEVR